MISQELHGKKRAEFQGLVPIFFQNSSGRGVQCSNQKGRNYLKCSLPKQQRQEEGIETCSIKREKKQKEQVLQCHPHRSSLLPPGSAVLTTRCAGAVGVVHTGQGSWASECSHCGVMVPFAVCKASAPLSVSALV